MGSTAEKHGIVMEIFNTELWSKHIFKSLLENMQDLPPEFSETVDKHFWELVGERKDWIGGHELYVRGDRN